MDRAGSSPRGALPLQLLPKTLAANERLARLRKQGSQLATLGMTDKVADNGKQQDAQAARIQVRAALAPMPHQAISAENIASARSSQDTLTRM